ncbi:MAG: helix-hairpin-helix domain-containing protein [Candidatus Omnitrophica bacterium]|nr:helix-hairpin-helix domain-containing protein [Candidatus Omnitrophota bacterium]
MFFTDRERLALLFFSLVLWLGMFLDVIWTTFPQWHARLSQLESDAFYLKVDVNRADSEALQQVPYIGAFTAQKILDYRSQAGCIENVEQIKTIVGVRQKNYDIFSKFLFVREAACSP